jgi:hypothetical protein
MWTVDWMISTPGHPESAYLRTTRHWFRFMAFRQQTKHIEGAVIWPKHPKKVTTTAPQAGISSDRSARKDDDEVASSELARLQAQRSYQHDR